MNLKELINWVERLQQRTGYRDKAELQGIRKTVEAVDKLLPYGLGCENDSNWQTLKKLLDVK